MQRRVPVRGQRFTPAEAPWGPLFGAAECSCNQDTGGDHRRDADDKPHDAAGHEARGSKRRIETLQCPHRADDEESRIHSEAHEFHTGSVGRGLMTPVDRMRVLTRIEELGGSRIRDTALRRSTRCSVDAPHGPIEGARKAGYGRLEHRHRQTSARVDVVALVSDAEDFVCHDLT